MFWKLGEGVSEKSRELQHLRPPYCASGLKCKGRDASQHHPGQGSFTALGHVACLSLISGVF